MLSLTVFKVSWLLLCRACVFEWPGHAQGLCRVRGIVMTGRCAEGGRSKLGLRPIRAEIRSAAKVAPKWAQIAEF